MEGIGTPIDQFIYGIMKSGFLAIFAAAENYADSCSLFK